MGQKQSTGDALNYLVRVQNGVGSVKIGKGEEGEVLVLS